MKNIKNLFFIAESFSANSGGRTKATFEMMSLLEDQVANLFVLTTNYKLDYLRILEEIKTKRRTSPKIQLLNIYEFFAGEIVFPIGNKVYPLQQADYIQVSDKRFVKETDTTKVIIKFRENGSIALIEKLDKTTNIKYEKTVHDFENTKRRTQFFNHRTGEVVETVMYKKDGSPYLVFRYEKNKCISVGWFENNELIKEFRDPEDMKDYWIAALNKNYDTSVFVSQVRNLDHTLIENPYAKDIKSIAIIHSTHLRKPYDISAKTNDYVGYLTERMDKYGAIIVLTHEQKHDLQQRYGVKTNIHVIRNPFQVPVVADADKHKENKIVVISRLVALKRLDDIVKAMADVVEENPTLRLEIYGEGEEQEKLQALIAELQLEKNVFLMGYTPIPIQELAKAKLFILTSQYEGLSYTTLESLTAGTPVISYALKYGPRDMIKHNWNGILVKNGDIRELSQKIKTTLADEVFLNQLTANATNIDNSFDNLVIKNQFLKVIEEVQQPKKYLPKLSPLLTNAKVTKLSFVKEQEQIVMALELECTILHPQQTMSCYLYINNIKEQNWLAYNIMEGDHDGSKIYFHASIPAEAFEELFNEDNSYKIGITYQNKTHFFEIDKLAQQH